MQSGREHEGQRVDPEREPDVDGGEQPRTREPDGRRPEGRDLEEGVGCRELLVARDLGDQRLVGGVEELLDARVDEDGDEQQRDVDAEQERDRGDDDRLEQVARHHDPAPVPAVHEHAGDEPDDQAGDRGGHEGHAHEERGPGLVVDVDARGEVRQGGAGGRHQLRQPHQDEVGLLEHRGRRDARRHCLVRRSRRGHRRRPGHPLPHGSSQSLHAPASRAPSRTRGLARSVRPRTASIRALPHTEDWLFDETFARGALARCVLFEGVDLDAMDACLACLRVRRFRRDETVFHQGDPGDALHVIASGAVKIVLPVARRRRARHPRDPRPGRLLRGAGPARRRPPLGVRHRPRADRDPGPGPRRTSSGCSRRSRACGGRSSHRSPDTCGA